jgi:hypothetical protein
LPFDSYLGAVNLENDILSLMEDKENNLNPTIEILGRHRGTFQGITAPCIQRNIIAQKLLAVYRRSPVGSSISLKVDIPPFHRVC